MISKPAITSQPIDPLIQKRWSGRAFVENEPVSREQIVALLEAARWAPSCWNDQPWRYIVFDRFHKKDAWQKAFECLSEGNQKWVIQAPVLLIAFSDTRFTRNGKPNRWGQHDTGAASTSLCLQAASMGLMAHQMGGYDRDKVRATFGIPDQFDILSMIAVGHPANEDQINPDELERELEPRERAPLGERFFDSAWENPIT
ncbi:MAG: nitroreductase family protein [Acidiferrobacterales bacterium]